jgi:hypothetical protein
MGDRLREMAGMEGIMLQYLFEDAKEFTKNLIAVAIDETTGKDTLHTIITQLGKKCPFLVLNDYRVAHATNSLRRIELL